MTELTSRPRLLIVESDESVRRVLGRALGHLYEVTPLASEASAVGRLKEERFDLLLLDLRISDPSAIELLRTIRALDPSLSIVVTTAAPDLRTERTVLDLGAVACLHKPFGQIELRDRLERVCARRNT